MSDTTRRVNESVCHDDKSQVFIGDASLAGCGRNAGDRGIRWSDGYNESKNQSISDLSCFVDGLVLAGVVVFLVLLLFWLSCTTVSVSGVRRRCCRCFRSVLVVRGC